MSSLSPRVVLVSRETEYAALIARHGTRGQAAFFLSSRGQSIAQIEQRDAVQSAALAAAKAAIPADWSFAHVQREDLSRFLFAPTDIVVPVGQDGVRDDRGHRHRSDRLGQVDHDRHRPRL